MISEVSCWLCGMHGKALLHVEGRALLLMLKKSLIIPLQAGTTIRAEEGLEKEILLSTIYVFGLQKHGSASTQNKNVRRESHVCGGRGVL